jgi:hypothetical protein
VRGTDFGITSGCNVVRIPQEELEDGYQSSRRGDP